MPKYWGKQILGHGSFPEVGQKQNRKRDKDRLNDGNNNGQLRIAMPPQVAHAKPPGSIWEEWGKSSQMYDMIKFIYSVY